jgi:hypothetical protein
MLSDSPLCKRLSKYPAASRAAAESGGVLISPCSHASGLSVGLTGAVYVISDISTSIGDAPPNHCMQPTPQPVIKFACADLSPAWRATQRRC